MFLDKICSCIQTLSSKHCHQDLKAPKCLDRFFSIGATLSFIIHQGRRLEQNRKDMFCNKTFSVSRHYPPNMATKTEGSQLFGKFSIVNVSFIILQAGFHLTKQKILVLRQHLSQCLGTILQTWPKAAQLNVWTKFSITVNNVKCQFCDMTCPNASALKQHVKFRHSEERPFKCDVCSYT